MSLRIALVALALGLAALPACKGKKSTNPGEPKTRLEKGIVGKKVSKARIDELVRQANVDLRAGRWLSAVKKAEDALAENPNNPIAYAVLGKAYWRGGDPAKSEESFEKALELDENEYGAGIGLAEYRRRAGDFPGAIELLKKISAAAPKQTEPHLQLLWTYYASADADNAVNEVDKLFDMLAADDDILPLVQAYAAYIRPVTGKGTLCEVTGDSGSMDVGVVHALGMKFSSAVVDGNFTRVVFFENIEETVVDAAFAKTLQLKKLGEAIPLGEEQPLDVVLLPKLEMGGVNLERVPARVRDLSVYNEAFGETPGVILGRQALHAFGSITFDFPARSLVVTKAAPAKPPEGAAEAPLLMLDARIQNAPIIPVKIDGSDREEWLQLGGTTGSSIVTTRKAYLRAGHRLHDLDDPQAPGVKMVYVSELEIGGKKFGGMGGLVMLDDQADSGHLGFLRNTEFEIDGYINTRLMTSWSVTYALNQGKVFIKPG